MLKKFVLCDAPFQGLSYVLDVKGPKISGLAQMALSPDGSKLAILNKESVELFELPPVR